MKDGELCIFNIPINGDVYAVKCECYKSFYDGKLAYGNTYYKNKKEIMHAGYGMKIDTLKKARKAIELTIKIHKRFIEEGAENDEKSNCSICERA